LQAHTGKNSLQAHTGKNILQAQKHLAGTHRANGQVMMQRAPAEHNSCGSEAVLELCAPKASYTLDNGPHAYTCWLR